MNRNNGRVAAIILGALITAMTVGAAALAPNTWERPIVAMAYMTAGIAVWAIGYTGGRRDR